MRQNNPHRHYRLKEVNTEVRNTPERAREMTQVPLPLLRLSTNTFVSNTFLLILLWLQECELDYRNGEESVELKVPVEDVLEETDIGGEPANA